MRLYLFLDDFGALRLAERNYVPWSQLPNTVRELWDNDYTGYLTVESTGVITHDVPLEFQTYFDVPPEDVYLEDF